MQLLPSVALLSSSISSDYVYYNYSCDSVLFMGTLQH